MRQEAYSSMSESSLRRLLVEAMNGKSGAGTTADAVSGELRRRADCNVGKRPL